MPIPFINAARAHEKWFVNEASVPPGAPDFYRDVDPWTVGAIFAICSAFALGRVAEARFAAAPFVAPLRKLRLRLRRHAVSAVTVTTGFFLMFAAARGILLADNLPAPTTAAGTVALAAEGMIGALLFVGWLVPLAALGLLVLYLSLFVFFAPFEAVDYLHYVGIAVFLISWSKGRFSAAWLTGRESYGGTPLTNIGYRTLRIATGLALAWLALSKWLAPGLHFALLDIYAAWNPLVMLHSVDFNWLNRENYVFLLAVVEMTFALFAITGTLTRLVAVMLMPMFVASSVFIGVEDIAGHLPLIGIFFALAVADHE